MDSLNNSQQNLTSFKSSWHSQPTQTIRVPVILADAILDFAHQLDNALSQVDLGGGGDLHYSISGCLKGLEDTLPY